MKLLLLGGTGAMGVALADILVSTEHDVYITSRSAKTDHDNIHYIQGNAKNGAFITSLLSQQKFDIIIDFMVYMTDEFEKCADTFLNHAEQYIFLSSSRVYADSKKPITEDSPRLLDICDDEEYLSTDEYALAKARQEDILKESGKNNWTIIRPYITFNTERLQLGVFEKEQWLYRALKGRSIVFSKDIAEKTTTLTFAPDVALGIFNTIGNEKAYGEAIHFVSPYSMKWKDILNLYLDAIEKYTGKRPKVKMIDSTDSIISMLNQHQVKYDRLYNRVFDSSKANKIIGKNIEYLPITEGIDIAVKEFIENKRGFLRINWLFEAVMDRIANEWTPIWKVEGKRTKIAYLKKRLMK